MSAPRRGISGNDSSDNTSSGNTSSGSDSLGSDSLGSDSLGSDSSGNISSGNNSSGTASSYHADDKAGEEAGNHPSVNSPAPDQSAVANARHQKSRNPLLQILMLFLSIYVLVTLSVESFLISDPEIRSVIQKIDVFICALFLLDFLYLFFSAPNKREYMRWGWLDLISSIPLIDPLRWGRLARVIRIFRVLRAFKSLKVIYEHVKSSPFETLSIMIFLIVFFSFSIGATLILDFERAYDSELKDANDALWWSFLSILNAKVNLPVPLSGEGIITGVYLNKIGILLFAYINGMVISWIVQNRDNRAVHSEVE